MRDRMLLLALLVCGLMPMGVQAQTATVTWIANTEADLAGYKLYRALGACGGAEPAIFLADLGKVTTYTDQTIPSNVLGVSYELTAYDTSGNESSHSPRVCKSLIPTVPLLPPPANFKQVGNVLSWDPVPGASALRLSVHEAGTPYDCATLVFCGPVTGTNITLMLKPGTTYDAWIVSVNSAGAAGEAQGLTFVTPPTDTTPPSVPSNLTVTQLNQDQVRIVANKQACQRVTTTGRGLERIITCIKP